MTTKELHLGNEKIHKEKKVLNNTIEIYLKSLATFLLKVNKDKYLNEEYDHEGKQDFS